MKIFTYSLIFFILVIANQAVPSGRLNGDGYREKIFLKDDDDGQIRVIDLQDTRLQKKANLKDLSFYFYTRNNIDNPVVIRENNIDTLVQSGAFNPSNSIVFIIHGWQNSHTSPVGTLITNAVLQTTDVNVFVADWAELADKNYFTSRFAVPVIGNFVANFIDDLVSTYQLSYKNFSLVGHSLGAHIAGIAGSSVATHVDSIVGLDPALPLFTLHDIDNHLDRTDADFVAIIHTSGGSLAFLDPLGHADYYPNGGKLQPGCFLDISCCHSRSYMYYAESIKDQTREFKSYECDSYHDFEKGKCSEDQNLSIMGNFPLDKNASGNYYLKTYPKPPFAEDVCNQEVSP